jgi:rhodanese-related sulfurtransferase
MKTILLATIVGASLASASPIPNKQIDYPGFERIVIATGPEREAHRLTEQQFLAEIKTPGTVVLDARSASKYALRHIKGAVNLPFTEFTADTLASVIPSKSTKILIYCNNNFMGNQSAFPSKAVTASLNVSTFTSLKSYGYTNIYELGPLLDVETTSLPFEGTEVQP